MRRFRPADGGSGSTGAGPAPRGGELVATFPDDLTARRAYAVLKAWRADCRQRLSRYARVRVGGLQDVAVTGGSASWYLLTYGPVAGDRDAAVLDAQGMTVVGSRIAMVSLVAVGQDYDYEPGQEPMVAALQRAAQKIG